MNKFILKKEIEDQKKKQSLEIIRSEKQKENNEEKWTKLKWVMGYCQENQYKQYRIPRMRRQK